MLIYIFRYDTSLKRVFCILNHVASTKPLRPLTGVSYVQQPFLLTDMRVGSVAQVFSIYIFMPHKVMEQCLNIAQNRRTRER